MIKIPSIDYDRVWKEVYGDVQHYGPTHRHTYRLCHKLLNQINYSSVLDVGCGPGHNHSLLVGNKNIPFVGLDISPHAIRRARGTYPTDRFEVLDIASGGLEERFDLVFSEYLLEHVADDKAALRNIMNMSNHYVLLVTIQGNFDRYEKTERLYGHLRNYCPGALQTSLREGGFDILQSIEWGFPFYSPLSRILTNGTSMNGAGRFGWKERLLASLIHKLYYLNSNHHGDVLILLAEKRC